MIENIIESVQLMLTKHNDRLPYDITFPSTVYGIIPDGTYMVPKENYLRKVKNATGLPLSAGQSVWVKIPSGRLNEMHICGVR